MTTIITRPIPARSRDMLVQQGLHPVLAQLYAARGVLDKSEVGSEFSGLISPERLLHAGRAATLLADAIEMKQRLLIVADYDCDGATACAVGVRALRAFGADVAYLVPKRFEYGYGLTPEIVELAARQARRPDLLITVDNGIASNEGVARANALGIATLITDHHLPGDTLPQANCIVNPNQPGCDFPSKAIAGVGVMFYVMLALRAELRRRGHFRDRPEFNLATLLDLVALGTAADVVRLDRNNRILVARWRGRGAPRVLIRPRLRRRASAQCRRAPGRHGAGNRVPDHRRCGARTQHRAGARPAEPRAARNRRHHAGSGAGDAGGPGHGFRYGRGSRRRSGLYPGTVRSVLAPGRGGHTRGAHQGPAAPAGDRLRRGQRGRTERIRAIDPGPAFARRARSRRQARARPDSALRRSCRRRGPHHTQRRPGAVWRTVREHGARAARRVRSRAEHRDRRPAGIGLHEPGHDTHAGARGLGPGFPAALVLRPFRCRQPARGRRQASETAPAEGRQVVRGNTLQFAGSRRRGHPRRLPAGGERVQRRAERAAHRRGGGERRMNLGFQIG